MILKGHGKKTQLNSKGNNHNLSMRLLMLFAITKRCNIWVKWSGWQKKCMTWMMIWQLQKQCTLGMFHFGVQLFTVVCNAKYAHCLLVVGDKVRESFRWKHMVHIEIEDVASKKLGLQIFWTLKISEFYFDLLWYFFTVDQSSGAVEYTDCISTER